MLIPRVERLQHNIATLRLAAHPIARRRSGFYGGLQKAGGSRSVFYVAARDQTTFQFALGEVTRNCPVCREQLTRRVVRGSDKAALERGTRPLINAAVSGLLQPRLLRLIRRALDSRRLVCREQQSLRHELVGRGFGESGVIGQAAVPLFH